MATITSIDDLRIWKDARELAKRIRVLSDQSVFAADTALKDQINRSAGSVMDNIAEGFGRGGSREFMQFLGIARGSLQEVKSQVARALDCNYINEIEFNELRERIKVLAAQITTFMQYLLSSPYRGHKFNIRD